VAINPATAASLLEELLPDLDQVLVMTVNPASDISIFLEQCCPKIRRVAQMIERIKPDCELEVDGGINAATAPTAVAAGANVLGAGYVTIWW
jgi:ribulose-phosphate 3-epimerase